MNIKDKRGGGYFIYCVSVTSEQLHTFERQPEKLSLCHQEHFHSASSQTELYSDETKKHFLFQTLVTSTKYSDVCVCVSVCVCVCVSVCLCVCVCDA